MVKVCWRNGPIYNTVVVDDPWQGFWICHAIPHVVENYDRVNYIFDIGTLKNTPNFDALFESGLLRKYEGMTPEEFLDLVEYSVEEPHGVDYWY